MASNPREGSPILCLDTCAILDVVRDPVRGDAHAEDHAASLALLRTAETDGRLRVLITDVVLSEFAENVDAVQAEAEASLARFLERIAAMNRLAALHDSPGRVDVAHWEGHVRRCRLVADRWLQVGTALPRSDEIDRRAMRRVFESRRPSRRGKDSTKDCVILETFLEHLRFLRTTDETAPAVFLSSNTRDFARPRGPGVADDIAEEFDSVGLRYASGMAGAKRLLGL